MGKKKDSGHRLGKVTGYGYEILADGKVQICRALSEPFMAILDRQNGLDEYARSVHEFMSKQYEQINKEKTAWWARIADDIEVLDGHRNEIRLERGGILSIIKKDTKQP